MLRRCRIAALRLAPELVDGLRVLGFERISDLLAQPRAPLTLRFGPELGRRLDQAIGRIGEPIEPIRPAELIEVRRAFAEPIGAAETIARYIGKLAVQLCEALELKGLGARRLDLICHRVDSRAQAVRVGTALPLRDAKRMTRLLSDKIETIEPGFGIEIMTLAATVAEPLTPKQVVTSLVAEAEPDVSGLIDLLANRVGEQNLYRAAPVASDVPERSVRHIPALAPETGADWPGHWPRPVPAVRPPRANRDGRASSRPPACHFHLARRAPPREAGGRPGARVRRMVEARSRADRGPRLFPHRGRRRRALLGVPRRRWRGSADRLAALVPARDLRMSGPRYAELQVTSHFSFLRGASSCEELFATAAAMGIEALAIVDRNSLAGIVRAHEAAKTTGVRLVVGCRLDLTDGLSVLVYPTDRPAYSRLCRLLSLGKKRAGKAKCELGWSDLVAYGDGLIAVLVPDIADEDCALRLRRLHLRHRLSRLAAVLPCRLRAAIFRGRHGGCGRPPQRCRRDWRDYHRDCRRLRHARRRTGRLCSDAIAAHPGRYRAAICSAGSGRRLSCDACPRAHWGTLANMARGIRHHRRDPCRRHSLGADDAPGRPAQYQYEPPPNWWTPLVSSGGSGKVSNGSGTASLHG